MSLADSIIYGDKNTVMSLLRQGADPNEIDEYGFRPLIEAAIVNKNDIAELLLANNAGVDEVDASGRTALHWAVENNNLTLCQLLLSYKANPNHYTPAGQPPLVTPILRGQSTLKNLLYDAGASMNFALDYINTKLIGHRYELIGQADIVTPAGPFIELDFEGFFLEFTLDIIFQSLQRYRNHFAARHLRRYFKYVRFLLKAFEIAAQLIKFQQYTINIEHYANQINHFLNNDLLIIPVAHQGHAITFIRYGTLFAKCDRGENSLEEGSINIYRVQNKPALNSSFYKQLIYTKQPPEFIKTGYKDLLNLAPLIRLPLASQITGNCSWSNVEAAVPTILFLLMAQTADNTSESLHTCINDALLFYKQWLEWDKDRALYDCLQSFEESNRARKASKAAILGAILFQSCRYLRPKDIERAEKILAILTLPDYRYILESYLDVYWRRSKTLPGKNLTQLLDMCGVSWY